MRTSIIYYLFLILVPILQAQEVDQYQFIVPGEIPAVREGHLEIGPSSPTGDQWDCTSRYITRNAEPYMPVMGEFHFSRFPADEWETQIIKIKAGGVDIIASYLFWIHHEEEEGVFEFSGQRDIRRFILLCQKHDMLVWLRLGPWCHGEVRNGGFPDWLRTSFNIEENGHLGWRQKDWRIRSNDSTYMVYIDRLYEEYGEQCKGLMAKDGGPIIGVQIENEYSKSGSGRGAEHIESLIDLAKEKGFDVPYYSVTGWHNAPFPENKCLPMFGGYPDRPWSGLTTKLLPQQIFRFDLRSDAGGIGTDIYRPQQDSYRDLSPYPLMTCEIGIGVQVTKHRRPLIADDDGVVAAFTRLGVGAACLGYYVYHGGTNPEGKLSTLQESKATGYPNECPVKSYDFQTAIRESGRIDKPYYKLRKMHSFMHDFGGQLASTIAILPDRSPTSNEDFSTTRMAMRTDGNSGFIFINNHIRCYPQPDRYMVQVAVNIKGKEILVPQTPTKIPSGAYFIWPVAMPLEDAVLNYATAQPLMTLNNDDVKTYIFTTTIGKEVEYVFDASTIKEATSQFNITAGLESLLELQTQSGKTIRIITLTEEQALGAVKYREGNNEYLITGNAALAPSAGQLTLFTDTTTTVNIATYPHLKIKEATQIKSTSSFVNYRVDIRQQDTHQPKTTKINDNTWQIKTANLLSGSRLRINYKGDIAQLYLEDQLIYDNFYNGEDFEVGLDRYAEALKEGNLTLKISALKPRTKMYLDVPMPWGAPEVKSISIVTETKTTLEIK